MVFLLGKNAWYLRGIIYLCSETGRLPSSHAEFTKQRISWAPVFRALIQQNNNFMNIIEFVLQQQMQEGVGGGVSSEGV